MTKRRSTTMKSSTLARNMTESSVIVKHYKKQLIYRQNETLDELSTPQEDQKTDRKMRTTKRKNKNCRGQFRHEKMELIKLGTPPSLCKVPRNEPPKLHPSPLPSPGVIQSPPILTHHLPQMVPDRRHSRETPPKVPVIYPPYPVPQPPLLSPPPAKRPRVEENIVAAIDLTVDKDEDSQCLHCGKGAKRKNDTNNNRGPRMPPLFLIKDLLAQGKKLEATKVTKTTDYTVNSIIGNNNNNNNRRQSVDIDTISVSSSGSDVTPKSLAFEKQIPYGKLCYFRATNSFVRYFEDTQKKLYIEHITSPDEHFYDKNEEKQRIELPHSAIFSSKDSLSVEEYVSEMILVEKYIPRDFFLFYKFVTGYQICNNNLPVSFLTFLKVYNTNGLKILLERYINSLKPN